MKLKHILLLILVLAMSVSCSKNNIEPKSNAEDKATYENTNTDGINGVYIITDKGPVPVAYTDNGKLSLAGDVYYYNLNNILENDDGVKQKTFTYFDNNGFNIGADTYEDFKKNAKNPYETLALSGNWRLYPDLRIMEYDEKNKAPSEYLEFIKESFKDNLGEMPIESVKVWETDLDTDGTNEAFVKAKTDDYTLLVMMSGTLGKNVLFSDFEKSPCDVMPFFADLDGNGKPSVLLLSGNELKIVTVFKEGTVNALYSVYLPVA